MKKQRNHLSQAQISDLDFDDLYDADWQEKSRRLQARRWRALKRSLKGGSHDHAT